MPRAMVVDDDEDVARALGKTLEVAGFDVTLAGTVAAAIESLQSLDEILDVVVLDWQLDGGETAERVVREVRRQGLPAGVVIISGEATEVPAEFVSKSGQVGFLPKPVTARDIIAGCQAACVQTRFRRQTGQWRPVIDEPTLEPLFGGSNGTSGSRGDQLYDLLEGRLRKIGGLTKRQSEVVRLIMNGRSDKEIAKALDIAESTVRTHMSRLMESVGADSRDDLIRVIAADLDREERERDESDE